MYTRGINFTSTISCIVLREMIKDERTGAREIYEFNFKSRFGGDKVLGI